MEKQDEIGGDAAKAVATHTPGPWTINNSMSGTYVYQGDSENCIAEVFADVHEDQDANARLIASAPDMRDALAWFIAECDRMAIDANQEGIDLRIMEKMARAAIAKASEQQ
jgi:hypothetical protein